MKKTTMRAGALLLALLLFSCGRAEQTGAETAGSSPDTAAAAPAAQAGEQTPAETEEATKKPVDLTAARDAILAECGIADYLDMEPILFSNLYDIGEEEYVQYAAFVTMSGIFPHEIVMFEAADEDAAADIVVKLERRLAEIMNQAELYDPENYALAQKCGVDRDGLYITFFMSPEAARMREIFASMR